MTPLAQNSFLALMRAMLPIDIDQVNGHPT
jgi:hypothetical protein